MRWEKFPFGKASKINFSAKLFEMKEKKVSGNILVERKFQLFFLGNQGNGKKIKYKEF